MSVSPRGHAGRPASTTSVTASFVLQTRRAVVQVPQPGATTSAAGRKRPQVRACAAGRRPGLHTQVRDVVVSDRVQSVRRLSVSVRRMEETKDEKDELPDRFIEHLYTWALECE